MMLHYRGGTLRSLTGLIYLKQGCRLSVSRLYYRASVLLHQLYVYTEHTMGEVTIRHIAPYILLGTPLHNQIRMTESPPSYDFHSINTNHSDLAFSSAVLLLSRIQLVLYVRQSIVAAQKRILTKKSSRTSPTTHGLDNMSGSATTGHRKLQSSLKLKETLLF